MSRWPLPLLLLIAACSKGPEADLPLISQARSLAAEWALVNEQAGQGHLNATYVQTMRRSIREELKQAAKSLTEPHSAYGQEIAGLLREPDTASPASLRARARHLKKIEDSLESA